MNESERAKAALVLFVASAIVDTVRECQTRGPVPEGSIYLALNRVGITLETYNMLIGHLVAVGLLERGPMHTLRVPAKLLEKA